MKTRLFNKSKFLVFVLLCTALICFGCAHFYTVDFSANAEQGDILVSDFLPQTDLENVNLVNTTAVYKGDNFTAIIDDSHLFTLYFEDKVVTVSQDVNVLKDMLDVKLYNEHTLFFSANARLYSYDLIDNVYSKVFLNNSTEEPVSYFDFNDNYLITSYQSTCKIFDIESDVFTSLTSTGIEISNGSNVAINDNDELFLVGNNGIYKTLANSPALQTNANTLTSHTPSQIIANNQFVYYVYDSKVYKISVDGGEPIELTTVADDNIYDLGNISAPKSISFYNENLIVVQPNSIQEFKIDDTKLVFNGFAIAKNCTAYNRISSTAYLIEKTGDSVAVLDDFKFTVFTNNSENVYDRQNYVNVLCDKIIVGGVMPTDFAFDGENALFLYNSGTANCFIKQLNISTQQINDFDNQTENKKVRAITYQSGRFYFLVDIGNDNSKVYSIPSSSTALTEEYLIVETTLNDSYNQIAVDVYGNVILATNTSLSVFNKQESYAKAWDKTGLTNITKIQTDLLGRVFVLDNGVLSYITSEQVKTYSSQAVKNFALDFVNGKAYLLFNNSEFINYTTQINNLSFDNLIIPSEFTFTNPAGVSNAKESLQFFTLKQGANAYKVEDSFVIGEKFVFDNLTDYSGEYVLICTVNCLDLTEFYVLANQTDIVLIEKTQAQEKQVNVNTDLTQNAFVATDVNAYYLPIITADDSFAMNSNGTVVRIEKLTEITLKHKLNFLGYDYYYAEFTANDTTQSVYIPCDYTVEVLTEDLVFNEYRLEKVKSTAIYTDGTMTTSVVSLSEGSLVRVISQSGEICKIAYKTQSGEYEIGYIYADKIIDEPNLAIRNSLLIIIIVACVCATSIYFIVRKKKHN